MNKAGATLTLTGNNTYDGTNASINATTVMAGTLQVGNGVSGNLTGPTGVTVDKSATLVTDLAAAATFPQGINLNDPTATLKAIQSGANTFTGIISGTGIFDQNGTGTTIISGTNTYTGATNVNAGVLEVDGSLAAGSAVAVATTGALTGAGQINGKVTLNDAFGVIHLSSGARSAARSR